MVRPTRRFTIEESREGAVIIARAHPRHRSRLTCAVALAGAVAALVSCSSSSSAHPARSTSVAALPASSQPPLGYRKLPSFLPTSSLPADRVVTATAGHPQLAVQGVGVRVETGAGKVLATVTGPHVPPFVTPPPPAVTAVFDVSLADARGSVPIRLSDFSITDQLGRTFHPTLVARETHPPSTARAGRTVSFQVTAVMPTGEGRLYWSPAGTAIVAWDFIVEND